MTDTKRKLKSISSLAAPTKQDMALWNAMTDDERREVIQARADEAVASQHRFVSAEDIIKAARAKMKHG
ncbi:MAG: hypothetical protein L3J67_06645 [Hyphomicrobiaceae bacterium]|nr:hypothetical protein [Hyphomicrobiaceae bacterium]